MGRPIRVEDNVVCEEEGVRVGSGAGVEGAGEVVNEDVEQQRGQRGSLEDAAVAVDRRGEEAVDDDSGHSANEEG